MNAQITNETLKDIYHTNGATLDAATAEPVYFTDGYQVSKRDLFTIDATDKQALLDAIKKALATARRGDCVGVWIDDAGIAYIDISERIANKADAMTAGKYRKQISIWDWAEKKCVFCNNH